MNRQDVIDYLESHGCVLVRVDKKGYSVYRNVINSKISGLPANDPIYPAFVCRICKTLGIDSPAEAKEAQDIIDLAHKKHGRD